MPLSNARGQWYDGGKNMCGIKNSVCNKILSGNPKAFFTHNNNNHNNNNNNNNNNSNNNQFISAP